MSLSVGLGADTWAVTTAVRSGQAYSSLVLGGGLLAVLSVFSSLAVVPPQAFIHHHLQAAVLLSHLATRAAIQDRQATSLALLK